MNAVVGFAGLLSRWAVSAPTIEHWLTPVGGASFVENHDLPMLDVQVDFALAAPGDPEGSRAGRAHAADLDSGPRIWTNARIASRLADVGAVLSAAALGHRPRFVSICAPVGRRQARLPDARSCVRTAGAAVPVDALAREKARTHRRLEGGADPARDHRRTRVLALLYPGHPTAATPRRNRW